MKKPIHPIPWRRRNTPTLRQELDLIQQGFDRLGSSARPAGDFQTPAALDLATPIKVKGAECLETLGWSLAPEEEQPRHVAWLLLPHSGQTVFWELRCPTKWHPLVRAGVDQLRPGVAAKLGLALLLQAAASVWRQAKDALRVRQPEFDR